MSKASVGYSPKECYKSTPQDDALASCVETEVMRGGRVTSLECLGAPPAEGDILEHDVRLLHSAHHADPFGVLGPHAYGQRREFVVRVWIKDAEQIDLRFKGELAKFAAAAGETAPSTPAAADQASDHRFHLHKRSEWLFQVAFKWTGDLDETDIMKITPVEYELFVKYKGDESGTVYQVDDAYRFGCSLSDEHLKLFQSGSCWHVDNLMGSHLVELKGVPGCRFSVWAPNAQFISVVGEWNQWDGRAHPMRRRHEYGVWELFVPLTPRVGHRYMYKIHTRAGTDILKIDPYAQEFENPPAHASVISGDDDAYKPDTQRYKWSDADWMRQRVENKDVINRKPMAIYEVHLPSWMRGDNNTYLTYRELAPRLVAHCKKLHFNYVEFLPLAHHPFEGSWGYQVSGLYAPYSRLGKPDDLKYLIDQLHAHGIGVFLDFVPAHFVKDEWALSNYDGEPCFEYSDPREGEHKIWGTKIFNFRRNEVRSFLLGAGYHWLRRYHIDGLRIDAVSFMLYKNYCRDPGDWIANEEGGDANLEAINMLQELNWVAHREFPGIYTMAEETTDWRGVTATEKGGLGFDAKWDLGWMNDTISYLCKPTPMRPSAHNKLTFRGMYVAHERWVLPLSHDEVVSGKGSLLDKCAFSGANFAEKLSTMKALLCYQVGLCGRPLLFMGAEFAQGREWKESRSLDWHEAEEPQRAKFMLCVSEILRIYQEERALHAGDDEPWNFKWNDCDSPQACVLSFIRSWEQWYNDVLVVCNFGSRTHHRYPLGVPHGGEWTVLLNSDDWAFGGNMNGLGKGQKIKTTQGGRLGWPYCLWVDIPAWGALIIKAPKPEKRSIELVETIKIAKAAGRPYADLQAELERELAAEAEEAAKAEAAAAPVKVEAAAPVEAEAAVPVEAEAAAPVEAEAAAPVEAEAAAPLAAAPVEAEAAAPVAAAPVAAAPVEATPVEGTPAGEASSSAEATPVKHLEEPASAPAEPAEAVAPPAESASAPAEPAAQ